MDSDELALVAGLLNRGVEASSNASASNSTVDGLLQASQDTREQQASADFVRMGGSEESLETESAPQGTALASESSSASPPSQHMRTTTWWAPIIKQLLSEFQLEQESLRPRTVLSACSGIFPEGEVFRASQLQINMRV